jgi:hypothetical protein
VFLLICFVCLQVGALIITPTRELATQINEVVTHFLKHLENKFTHMLFIGGNNPAMDVNKFLTDGFVMLLDSSDEYLSYYGLDFVHVLNS